MRERLGGGTAEREKEKGTSVRALPGRLDSGKCDGVPATKIRGCSEEKREMGGAEHRGGAPRRLEWRSFGGLGHWAAGWRCSPATRVRDAARKREGRRAREEEARCGMVASLGRRRLAVKVVRIILRTDPIRIRILRIWIRTFNICADTDNPNPIVCGYGVGYGIGKIRRIWIIRKFYVDYPMFKIGYPKVSLPRLKNLGF